MEPEPAPIDPADISLERLRDHQAREWERAHRLLWQRGWAVASGMMGSKASRAEIEDVVAKAIDKEVVAEIINPTSIKFSEARSFHDVLNLAAARVRLRVIDEWRRMTDKKVADESLIESAGETPSGTAPEDPRLDAIRLHLARIGERCRNLFLAFYSEGLKTQEIADRWGEPHGTICSALLRCRKRLKDLLDGGDSPA